jgi:hypothetical protein
VSPYIYTKRHADKYKAAGRCIICGRSSEDFNFCSACKERTNAVRRANRSKKQQEGKCYECGTPAVNGKTRCVSCLEHNKTNHISRRGRLTNANLCSSCGKAAPIAFYRTCQACLDKQTERRLLIKRQIMAAYGSVCACCGESRLPFLTIDHINGNGNEHRKELNGRGCGEIIYRWLIKNDYPKGYRVLCMNCNFAIGHFGFCPHEEDRKCAP